MKRIILVLTCFIFVLPFKANAVCSPCDPCWITGVGGPIVDLGGVGEVISKGVSETQKKLNYAKQQANSLVNQSITTLNNGATSVLESAKDTEKKETIDMFGE